MSGLLSLKGGITYGPVTSRRLGRSLGINLLPRGHKVCPFDCVYCQYGWTPDTAAFGDDFPSALQVAAAVAHDVAPPRPAPAYITFSGHGEPTLHPDFPAVVEAVRRVRDRAAPGARVAILSNAATVGDPRIRHALARLDTRIMKLDCGTEEAFRRFNRPAPGVSLDGITAGLQQLGGVTLQALFAGGNGGNSDRAEVTAWVERAAAIAPIGVQVYTLARAWPAADLEPLSRKALEGISTAARARGIPAEVF